MGLDMYLYKKNYVKNWDFMSPEERHEITITKNGEEVKTINKEKIVYIIEELAYWRKFNALHKWFVDNCQEGIDDCRDAYVNRIDLETLLNTLREVSSDHSKASELLPVGYGFFFGSDQYDEYYFANVDDTIKTLEEIIKNDADVCEYTYSSSW